MSYVETKSMRLIVAIIRPEKLSALENVLRRRGANTLSISRIHGESMEGAMYRGTPMRVHRPKLRLEIVADESSSAETVDEIVDVLDIGDSSDNNDFVFAMTLDECFAAVKQRHKVADHEDKYLLLTRHAASV